jgi:phosphatidylethanolamine/phosphatidyl-N-methylethanolamine N-methyltransferase
MSAVQVKPTHELSNAEVEHAYAFWAKYYDRLFKYVFAPGRKAAVTAINRRPGRSRVLDVGIGTGLELPLFKMEVSVTGIDLSEPMLAVARKRVTDEELWNVEDLIVMDALNLEFPDSSFDAVVAPFVLSVVPDPVRMLEEVARVVKRGGDIVIVNHIGATRGPVAWVEAWLGKYAHKLGWHPQFQWSVVSGWLETRKDIELVERYKVSPCRMFTVMRFRRKTV